MLTRLLAVIALAVCGVTATAQERTAPAGFTVTPVLDNTTIEVVRLRLAPGARETPHTHSYAMLVIVLSRSEMKMQNGGTHTTAVRKPGELEFVGAGVSHAAANVGSTPLDALAVAIKPTRVRGGTAAPPQPLPGLSRTSLLDNSHVVVTRLEFEPEVREPVHTHPYDLLVVPITSARIDMQVGGKKTLHTYAIGETIFIPRGVLHTGANAGTAPFRILGVAIK
jgi:quercetin dioxygenase-like cupin family protein